MSVYKHPKSPFYQFDFVIDGHRFHGSTRTKNKREAIAYEEAEREQARRSLAANKPIGRSPLTMDIAAARYWDEVAQHHTTASDYDVGLEGLIAHFGREKRLDAITDADVASLVSKRRAQTARSGKNRLAPATVNRWTVNLLRAIFNRAKETWGFTFSSEPRWKNHKLKVPQERIRELNDEEADALDASVREDYAPWFDFARISGRRRQETLIKWTEVNIFAKRIVSIGKGGRIVSTPITPEIAAILKLCEGHHPDYVFTFVCRRPKPDQVKGARYPITASNAESQWKRMRARANVKNFRFHDIRHDVATKLLRETGNLKLVQRALNHADIRTTTKYAHVLDEEVATAMQKVAKSRKKSRNGKAGNA